MPFLLPVIGDFVLELCRKYSKIEGTERILICLIFRKN